MWTIHGRKTVDENVSKSNRVSLWTLCSPMKETVLPVMSGKFLEEIWSCGLVQIIILYISRIFKWNTTIRSSCPTVQNWRKAASRSPPCYLLKCLYEQWQLCAHSLLQRDPCVLCIAAIVWAEVAKWKKLHKYRLQLLLVQEEWTTWCLSE